MLSSAVPSEGFAEPAGRRRGGRMRSALVATTLVGTAVLAAGVLAPSISMRAPPGPAGNLATQAPSTTAQPKPVVEAPSILDPKPILSPAALAAWPKRPLAAAIRPASVVAAIPAAAPTASARPVPEAPRWAQAVPLPVPRPPELRDPPSAEAPRLASRGPSRRTKALPPQADNRSFFEKLFGLDASPAPRLAYAALDGGPVAAMPAPKLSPVPAPSGEAGTAVYDISARTVTLPSGERLEAHSGLGDKLDDPGAVHVRMRGATPPGTYDLTEREAPFHGVRALRLNPVGGAGAVFGRAGLLAHTFMLGPNGDSNGCVSFRDYDRFLQAYLRGEVRRLVVVPGRGLDGLRRFGGPSQPAGRAGDA